MGCASYQNELQISNKDFKLNSLNLIFKKKSMLHYNTVLYICIYYINLAVYRTLIVSNYDKFTLAKLLSEARGCIILIIPILRYILESREAKCAICILPITLYIMGIFRDKIVSKLVYQSLLTVITLELLYE